VPHVIHAQRRALNMKKIHIAKNAFSLVEVLIFVVVFSLFFVTAATIVTSTLRITTENQNKIKANHYVEELGEWLRSEKEINWGGTIYLGSGPINSFTEQVTILNPNPVTDFCFNSSPIIEWPSSGTANCGFSMDGQFRRIATFSATISDSYVNQIAANISTEWHDGAAVKVTTIRKIFSIWE